MTNSSCIWWPSTHTHTHTHRHAYTRTSTCSYAPGDNRLNNPLGLESLHHLVLLNASHFTQQHQHLNLQGGSEETLKIILKTITDTGKLRRNSTGCLPIFRFHQFSGMNFRAQFQISLFLGGAVYVWMALYQELAVSSCRIIDRQPVLNVLCDWG